MTINQLQLLFQNRNLTPTTIAHRRNGTTALAWHVDNSDDRFVLVADSAKSEDFLLVSRDERKAEAVVLADGEDVIRWVAAQLRKIESTSALRASPR